MTRHGKRAGSPFNAEKVIATLNPQRHEPDVSWWLTADFYARAKREAPRMGVSKIAHSMQRVAYAPAS